MIFYSYFVFLPQNSGKKEGEQPDYPAILLNSAPYDNFFALYLIHFSDPSGPISGYGRIRYDSSFTGGIITLLYYLRITDAV